MKNNDNPSRSRALAAQVLYAALSILKDRGGEAPGRELVAEVPHKVDLDGWAKEIYEKSGKIRWQSILHFFSIDALKAGFLVKKKGVWYLTPEGEKALDLGPKGLLDAATAAYRDWRLKNPDSNSLAAEEQAMPSDAAGNEEQRQEATIQENEEAAIEGIKTQINKKNEYEFQDLVAALLRGMGYYTPFVAPKGKDGGVDIIAYRDPLGTVTPRIKVQIKHRDDKTPVTDVRQLMGLLQKEGDVGIFVSSGGFSPDAKAAARSSHVHVELIDIDRFVALWQEFYPKMADDDKAYLSLIPIYFYAPGG
jgi:restriction system protein